MNGPRRLTPVGGCGGSGGPRDGGGDFIRTVQAAVRDGIRKQFTTRRRDHLLAHPQGYLAPVHFDVDLEAGTVVSHRPATRGAQVVPLNLLVDPDRGIIQETAATMAVFREAMADREWAAHALRHANLIEQAILELEGQSFLDHAPRAPLDVIPVFDEMIARGMEQELAQHVKRLDPGGMTTVGGVFKFTRDLLHGTLAIDEDGLHMPRATLRHVDSPDRRDYGSGVGAGDAIPVTVWYGAGAPLIVDYDAPTTLSGRQRAGWQSLLAWQEPRRRAYRAQHPYLADLLSGTGHAAFLKSWNHAFPLHLLRSLSKSNKHHRFRTQAHLDAIAGGGYCLLRMDETPAQPLATLEISGELYVQTVKNLILRRMTGTIPAQLRPVIGFVLQFSAAKDREVRQLESTRVGTH